jgi:TonB family protein
MIAIFAAILALAPSDAVSASDKIFANSDVIEYAPPRLIEVRGNEECRKRYLVPVPTDDAETNEPVVLQRCLPEFPRKCFMGRVVNEAVELLFDVDAGGRPANIRIARTTDKCFDSTAARTVAKWRYAESQDGHRDVRTTLTFHIK